MSVISRTRESQATKVHYLKCDINDLTELQHALEGVDAVCHLAGYTDVSASVKNPLLTMNVNFTGTLNIMEAARKNDVGTVVLASSARVYGDPTDLPVHEDHPLQPKEPYGASKAAAELIVQLYHQLYGIRTVILRPFSIYGAGRVRKQGTLTGVIPIFVENALLGQDLVVVGDGNQTKDFTHISDLVAALKISVTEKAAGGRTFNIATGIGTRVRDLAEMILEVCNSNGRSQIVFAPSAVESVSNYADVTRARDTLGWVPLVKLREGLIEYIDWYKEYLRGGTLGVTE